MDLTLSPAAPAPASPVRPSKEAALRKVAQELEATFLSEMLKHAGLGEARDAFGGGPGEAQFASMLRDAQAREMALQGGIGLAEAIFDSLKERADD